MLAHPNICALHDVGEEDGHPFLVMEHVVCQTLPDRLKKGPLPLEKALEVATQIADGLAAAHKQGIIHRDSKPGNVMLTKTGRESREQRRRGATPGRPLQSAEASRAFVCVKCLRSILSLRLTREEA